VITDIVWGVIMAAPKPWKTRAMMSISTEAVSPHHSDAAVKRVNPIR